MYIKQGFLIPLMLGSFMVTSVYGFTDSNTDTDKDGISDRVEERLGLNPKISNLPASDIKKKGFLEGFVLPGTTVQERYRYHIMNRLAFGANDTLMKEIHAKGGTKAWIIDQLENPQTSFEDGNDKAQDMLNYAIFWGNGFGNSGALQTFATVRPLHSEHQLQAVMGRFWDNHFNTEFKKHKNIDSEMIEADKFYFNAFGSFESLLKISAKSPAMLQYLDGFKSTKKSPNENYAREVMELHTLGVNGGYGDDDIVTLSKIFTGWGIESDSSRSKHYDYTSTGSKTEKIGRKKFKFRYGQHDNNGSHNRPSNRIFLKQNFSYTWQQEGEEALHILATHNNTATFICKKLAKFFISDEPSKETIRKCKGTFLAPNNIDNQIGEVLKTLFFNTPQFRNKRRNKVKDTQEYILSVARLLELDAMKYRGKNQTKYLGRELFKRGQSFFDKPEPTGYAEVSTFWNNTSVAMKRLQFVNRILKKNNTLSRAYSLSDFFKKKYGENVTESDIIFYLLPMTTGGYYTGEDVGKALKLLNPQYTRQGHLEENHLRNLVSWLVSRAEFNVQ